jgi:adenosylcobinamide-GDP ribazoletransferase
VLTAELAGAFTLLTRLPVAALFSTPPPDPRRCVWAYPLVGALTGAIGAGSYWLCARAGLPPLLAGLWTLAAGVLVTGALHEDGLADTADGFGGGASVERKLEIMRDSRIGSYGTLALVLSVLLRWAAIAALAAPALVGPALIAAGALSRGAMALPVLALPPARSGGLGASLRGAGPIRLLAGPALAALLALALLPIGAALAASSLGLAAALALAVLARRQIGGYTGDVLGASAILVECVVLSVLAAR